MASLGPITLQTGWGRDFHFAKAVDSGVLENPERADDITKMFAPLRQQNLLL